jgi:predicted porin
LLQQSNIKALFLGFVMECCKAVWFNSANFPKTEVGSGKSGAPVQTLENLEMKKTLVAIAALAAFGAQAQSAVTIDGQFDTGYQSLKYKGTSVTGFAGNGSTTSQINFRGVEDLGGGMQARFRVETDWNTASNNGNTGVKNADGTVAGVSSFGNGEIRGGIAGGFGAVDFGAINNSGLTAFLTGQPYGTAIGSSFRGLFINDTSGANGVRFDNSARYTTPSFSGISGTLLRVNKQTVATTANFGALGAYDYMGVNEFSINYNNGPLNATYSSIKQDYDGVGATAYTAPTLTALGASTTTNQTFTTKLNTLGANYALNASTKVYFLNQTRTKSDGTLDRAVTTVSASYTMGANVFTAQMGSGKDKGTAGNNASSKLTSVGYDYNLSKLSSVYVRYENTKDDGGWVANAATIPSVAGDTTRTRTALGLRIGF